jgi:transposase InsO family protein
MGMGRYVVDAVLLEGRSARDVARAHGISKSWIYELIRRFRSGGYEALEPHSKRPRSCRHQTSVQMVRAIARLRGELEAQGREGLVVPQRQKRPHSSLIRFAAELPNELWQADVTAWELASGEVVEILNQLDDHSRLHLGSDAYLRVKAADVVSSFHKAAELHGLPESLLSDNGAVFVGGYRGGKVMLEHELERLGVNFKNSRPYHPQTLGKVCVLASRCRPTGWRGSPHLLV